MGSIKMRIVVDEAPQAVTGAKTRWKRPSAGSSPVVRTIPAVMLCRARGNMTSEKITLSQLETDDKAQPEAVRKEEQIKTALTKSPRAKLLKLADKTSNLRAIAASAPAKWSIKRRIEYVRWARDVAKGLRNVNQKLEDQFDDAAAAAERSCKPAI
jgi:hypothetical protein